ncbi:MAG: hypothetical protein DA328_03675 [Nitrososphaeraceae archaeon]|nr:hypothetical protein [Nitrososphaeraceae archaeon]
MILKVISFLCITLATLTLFQSVNSLYFGDNVNLAENEKDFFIHPPQMITTEGGNVYVLWADKKNNIYFSLAQKNETKFSYPVILGDNATILTRVPQVAATEGGNVYVLWADKKNGSKGQQTELEFRWSKDAGETFKRKKLDTSPDVMLSSPQVAATEGGNVYVLWAEPYIHFREIIDDDKTYFGEKILLNRNINSSDAQLTATEGGNVYVLWMDRKYDLRDAIMFKKISKFLFD